MIDVLGAAEMMMMMTMKMRMMSLNVAKKRDNLAKKKVMTDVVILFVAAYVAMIPLF